MAQTVDFFRARLGAMIDLRHPLAVLATRLPWLPWLKLEAELAPIWRRGYPGYSQSDDRHRGRQQSHQTG